MATKAQQTRAESQKKGPAKKKTKKLSQRKPKRSHAEPVAAGRKASVARETVAKGKRPSRKSTRASANRVKADAPMEIHGEAAASSPKTRATTAKAKATKARGSKK